MVWNGATVATHYDGNCSLFTDTYYLMSIEGTNRLAFEGLGTIDGYGILIRNVFLRQMKYSGSSSSGNNSNNSNSTNPTFSPQYDPFADGFDLEDLEVYLNESQYSATFRVINFLRNFRISKAANTIFASKQNIKFLLGLILEFNHLLLYNYHMLNYTIMSNVILVGVQALDEQKGMVLDEYIYPFLSTSPQ